MKKYFERQVCCQNLPRTTLSAKIEGIFALELSKTLYSLDISSKYMWVYAKGVEKPWHMSQGAAALVDASLGVSGLTRCAGLEKCA